MAWANDARCLHCGARLALYRKFTAGEFCSAAHRAAYEEKHERLAVERLQETQALFERATGVTRLEPDRADAPREGPPEAGLLTLPVSGHAGTATMLALDPMAYDFPAPPAVPEGSLAPGLLALARATEQPMIGLVRPSAQIRVQGTAASPARRAAAALVAPPPTRLEPDPLPVFHTPEPGPMTGIRPLDMPDPQVGPQVAARASEALEVSPSTWLPLAGVARAVAPVFEPPLEAAKPSPMPRPSVPLATPGIGCVEPLPVSFSTPTVPSDTAVCARLKPKIAAQCLSIALPEPTEAALVRPEAGGPEPLAVSPALPRNSQSAVAAGFVPNKARPLPLQPGSAVEAPLTWGLKSAAWMPFDAGRPMLGGSALPPRGGMPALAPELSLAVGAPPVSMPDPRVVQRGIRPPEFEPGPTAIPRLRITPLHITREASQDIPRVDPKTLPPRRERTPWLNGRTIRMAAFVAPVTFLLVFLARQPSTEAASHEAPPVSQFVNAKVNDIRTAIQNRAGIEFLDDFRSGLDNWDSKGSLDQSWSYDQTGFVKPGPLALYRPSLGMAEYSFEFLGQIDRRALSWVYRAQDLNNYHVAKLVVVRPGPLPTIGLVRYSVIKGRETKHTETVLPLNVHADTIYRIRMEARGSDFSLYVQNQMVQFWSDWRLPSGGVGFFSGRGEQSRIRWMQISHQYDAIGKLCAYFAPMAVVTYNLQPTMGARTE